MIIIVDIQTYVTKKKIGGIRGLIYNEKKFTKLVTQGNKMKVSLKVN